MPSTYAHYKMGKDIINNLSKEHQKVIKSELNLFQVGLQGPDIFYYYRLINSNDINRMGYDLHKESGIEFFEEMRGMYRRNGNREKHISYIYGSLCHYILDVECHKYIEEVVKRTYLSHAEIEIEFDKKLMHLDKENPIRERIMRCTKLKCDDVAIVKDAYNEVSCRTVAKTLNWFRQFAGMSVYFNQIIKLPKLRHFCVYIGRRLSKDIRKADSDKTRVDTELLNLVSDELVLIYKKVISQIPLIMFDFDKFLGGRELDNEIFKYDFNGRCVEDGV